MDSTLDYLARAQTAGRIRFLVIGGRGLSAHGIQRFTKDLDLAVATSQLEVLSDLLGEIGYRRDFELSGFVRFTHSHPAVPHIDAMKMNEVTFSKAIATARAFEVRGHALSAPGVEVYVAMKLLAMRNQAERRGKDLRDIEELLRRSPEQVSRESLRSLCDRFGVPGDFELLCSYLHEA